MAFASLSLGNIWSTVSNSASTSCFVTATVATWKSGARKVMWINFLRPQSVVSKCFEQKIFEKFNIARLITTTAWQLVSCLLGFLLVICLLALQCVKDVLPNWHVLAISRHSKTYKILQAEFKVQPLPFVCLLPLEWILFGTSVLHDGCSKHLIGTCLTCLDLSHQSRHQQEDFSWKKVLKT